MENITNKLNAAIDYIEKHLTEEIDQRELARAACCSYFDVGRMFSLIAGISLADYIRRRRLTMAGLELKYENAKVIDVALKYGYDSPVSFTRAFQTFHGINPSALSREAEIPKVFPRLIYQIQAKEVLDMIRTDTITVNGKKYAASYFGEEEMTSWTTDYLKREFWRLEDVGEDFKDKPEHNDVLPYNNYPPLNIELGQVFVVDSHRKDGTVERFYYIADGTVWENLPCTRRILPDYLHPLRTDKLIVAGKELNASYFGEIDMSEWSEYATKREYWRLENAGELFKNCDTCYEVLPYNNYPPIKFEEGQIFAVDYHTKAGPVERVFYIADGTVWDGMTCTRKLVPQFD